MGKKVLITGANSYIGTSVEKWLAQWPGEYEVDTIDMVDGSWRQRSFGEYDVVFHVAGIAHSDVGQASEERKAFYYKINTELAIETARKAKEDGVKQFIFMSSIIVYGDSAPIGKKKIITKDTIPSPANFYGDSKLQAEKGILSLKDETFKVVVLRPPMIYGKGSKGNYPLLVKMARKTPIFPNIQNERSILYIGNLCEFVRLMIQNEENGIFFPQNREYVQTSRMVEEIAALYHKKIYFTRLFNFFLILIEKSAGRLGEIINKAFGNMIYEKAISFYTENYQIYGLEESIHLTEKGN